MSFSPLIQELIQALRCLPGVGPKSAQRMAFHLLQHQSNKARELSHVLDKALNSIKRCQRCRTLTEETVCHLCNNTKRNQQILCIVENPSDILAIEQTATYHGVYFVLTGHLSPIDGIGPEQIGVPQLLQQIKNQHISEIILALNSTVEGLTTSHFIANSIKPLNSNIKITRLAQGIPMGSELEFTDGSTLAHAFIDRTELSTTE